MEWSTACPDWADRLREGRSIIPAPIFPDQAEQALAIFKELKVVDLPGRPTFGECSDPWVFDFVSAVFGAYDAETGKQLIRKFYLLISKKNTKSTIAAGIMLTALILCFREEEEHLILAPTKEIADNSFKPAAAMVRADEELSEMFHIQEHLRTITDRVTRSSLKVVAADSDTVSGKKAGRVLVDEHWLFGKRPGAPAMFTEAFGGQVSRDEGWIIILTTQSDEPPAGVFRDELLHFRQIRDGKIHDPRALGVLYEFPQDIVASKGYLDPANWRITNPNLGRSVSQEWLLGELREKQSKTDGSFQQFLAKHLNVEIGLSLMSDRWAGADYWEAAGERMTLEDLLARCEVIDVGVDGGGLDDLLGLTLIGREVLTGRWLTWSRCWVHKIALERRMEIAPRLRDFEQQGDLVIVERLGDDIEQVVDVIERVFELDLLDKIGVDPVGISSIVEAIEDRGISSKDGPPELNRIVGISQGYRLGGAVKTAERKVADGELKHAAQPLMAWQVSNARVEPRANGILITKQASGTGKIDALMALFNAVTLMSLNPQSRRIGEDFELITV